MSDGDATATRSGEGDAGEAAVAGSTSVDASVPAEPRRSLHPDHVAAMLRAEALDQKLAAKQRTLEGLETDLRKVTRDLEIARREAAEVPRPRPATRVGLLGAGAAFGVIAAVVIQAVVWPSPAEPSQAPEQHPLDLPLAGPAPDAPSVGRDRRGWRGRIVTSTSPSLPPGTTCEITLAVTPGNDLPCQARIDCGGRTLYGPAPSGLFACRLDGFDAFGRARISGRDDQVTAGDGDPAMHVDTGTRTVRVWESSYGRETFDVTIALEPG